MLLLPAALASVLDATRTIPMVSTESLAMGSAGMGFACGANGMILQPAAPALRAAGRHSPVSLSLALSAESFGTGAPLDISNLGVSEAPPGALWKVGVVTTFRHWGLGLVSTGLQLGDDDARLGLTETHLGGGGSVLDGRIAFGAGYRLLEVEAVSDEGSVDWTGGGLEAGVMGTALGGGFNASLAFRGGVRAESQGGGALGGDVQGAEVPWELAGGAGWASRQSPWQGRLPFPLRGTFDLVLDGAVADGLAPESLLVGRAIPRGRHPTLAPHLGVEAELWPERFRLRGGAWLEPARSEGGQARLHGSAGTELKLLHIRALKGVIDVDLSWETGVDVAARYRELAWLGFGLWGGGLVGYDNLSGP